MCDCASKNLISRLTIARHSEGHAFLESAELASVPVHPVDDAVLLARTLVVGHAALGAPEEPLAALASDHLQKKMNSSCKKTRRPTAMVLNFASI